MGEPGEETLDTHSLRALYSIGKTLRTQRHSQGVESWTTSKFLNIGC